MAGLIREAKSGEILDKPGRLVKYDQEFMVNQPHRFVSRAGDKLEGFLKNSSFRVEGKVVLDVGSSTGGFSDCVLQRGAKKVIAVDVGTHQMHESLRAHPQVELHEQTDIRDFDFDSLQEQPELIVVDVSFISIFKFLSDLRKKLPNSRYILLFKPQFEAGRHIRRKKGVVNEQDRKKALQEFIEQLKKVGFRVIRQEDSTVRGTKGNQETLIEGDFQMPSHVFRSYDIRGHAENDLSSELFLRIGRVLAHRIEQKGLEKKVGIGRDTRVSSPRLFEALARGLQAGGMQLFNLGDCPTPLTYFAKYHFQLAAVFQVTASHNPAQDNGIKMVIGDDALFGDEIRSIGEEVYGVSIEEQPGPLVFSKNLHDELSDAYLQFLHSQIKLKKKYKIVLDTGNGMSGVVARLCFEPYASYLEILYEQVDCSFPNHPADPTVVENLQDLIQRVKETRSDIGFAFDGDGDRVGLVSQSGRIFWGDEILMLLSEKLLKEQKGAPVIGEVKCSEKLFQMIEARGGVPVMYKTGHSLIKKKMKDLKAPIAGEMSGHMFFSDRFFGYDDAIYAALRILEVVDELDLDLDKWISQFPQNEITPEVRIDVLENEKQSSVERVKREFEADTDAKLFLLDGVRASFSDGAWVLVRASNTQAALVARIEAPDELRMQQLKARVEKAVGKSIKW